MKHVGFIRGFDESTNEIYIFTLSIDTVIKLQVRPAFDDCRQSDVRI